MQLQLVDSLVFITMQEVLLHLVQTQIFMVTQATLSLLVRMRIFQINTVKNLMFMQLLKMQQF